MVMVSDRVPSNDRTSRRSRRGILLSSVFVGIGAGAVGIPALADEVTIGGVACPLCIDAQGLISAPGGFSEVNITVDTAPIGSAGAPVLGTGVYAFTTEDLSVTATQDITATGWAMLLDSNSVVIGEGDITVTSSGALTSTALTAVEILNPYANFSLDGQGTGTIGALLEGVEVFGGFGPVTIRDFRSIVGGTTSIYVDSNDADVSIQGVGQIGDATTTGDAIYVDALFGGDINIGGETAVGSIQGGDDGIEAYTSADGRTTISVAGDVTGGDFGIYSRAENGATDISINGSTVEGTLTSGIDARTFGGAITATGSNGAALIGEDRGIRAETEGGRIAINGFDRISSAVTAVEVFSFGGDIEITGNGFAGGITGTAFDGILASGEATGGNVMISGNGVISGGDDGIEAYAFGDGTMTIASANDVTGGDFGIYARSVNGVTDISILGGTVEGVATTGIDALATGTGSITIDIAEGATVQGALFGLVTGSGTDAPAARVTNAGVIRDSEDDGSAMVSGGDAVWAWTGSTVLDNEGDVVGRLHSDGTAFTFNNLAEGRWYAGTGINPFDSVSDSLNNAGTVFVRDGVTTLSGLESFVTLAGGHTNLSYSRAATDTLNLLNMSTQSCALLSFDFDATAINGAGLGFDNASDGLGTADTIVVTGTATPAAGTLVAVNHVNGDGSALTGSVALVYTGTDMNAPNPGDRIVSSSFYGFEAPRSFAATAYYLVDDGDGGLYYQWAPNLTTATLGAYGGGDMADPRTADANVASAASPFAGLGGIGASGGGVTTAIADRAASSARQGGGDDQACGKDRDDTFWVHTDGASMSGAGNSGNSFGATFGYEHDLGDATGKGCGQLVAGAFAGLGNASLSWGGGLSKSSNVTAGSYLRYASLTGFYASGTAAMTWSEADLSNGIFRSTATQNSVSTAGIVSVGYVMPVGIAGSIDLRGDVSRGVVDGEAFTDSAGIVVDDTQRRINTSGLSLAYNHRFDDTRSGFIRAGVKWSEAKREVTAFGVTVNGTSDVQIGTLAAGFSSKLSEQSKLDLALHGAFTGDTSSVGGSIRFKMAF